MAAFSLHVLLYHDVALDDAAASVCTCPDYTTPVYRLREHLRIIQESGCKPVRMEDVIRFYQEKEFPEGRYVLLTFDGPHTGWFQHVIPILCEAYIPATFFITAGWVGDKHLYPESRHLVWDDVASILTHQDSAGDPLFSLGNHSMWHSVLLRQPSEDASAFDDRLNEEIVLASDTIHRNTGYFPHAFATPKGEGNIEELAPYFEKANISAVRWAHWPSQALASSRDMFDLQMAFCDVADRGLNDFKVCLELDPT